MIQTVKLAKLVPSEINVRKTAESIEQLAADIAARGILQNLVVTSVRKPRGAFAVIAGGRRLRALTLLAENGDIDAAQYDVPVLVLAGDDSALSEASLAENFQHLAMSPADECRAFQHFLAGNDNIDGVAKRFGVTRRFVEGRLRLAKLAEPIFAALATAKITLDLAKAYASTESHDKQLLIWGQYGHQSYVTADTIRRVIANEAMSSTDPVALLVGVDAYVAAGGAIDRDLFSDNADRWLAPEIAQNLAAAIMEAEAKRIGEEQSLAWIRPIAGTSTWEAARNLFRVSLPETPMSVSDIARLDAICERISVLETEMEDEELTEDAYTVLSDEVEALETERSEISRRPRVMPAELAPRVGTFLLLSHTGQMKLDDDYYSETPLRITMVPEEPAGADETPDDTTGDEQTKTVNGDTEDDSDGDSEGIAPAGDHMTFRIEDAPTGGVRTIGGKSVEVDPDNAAPGGKALSQVLADQLAVQRRDVLGAALIANPSLALDYMLFVMVDTRTGSTGNTGTTIRASHPQDPVLANNVPASRARDYLAEVHDGLDASWTSSSDKVARFEAFRILSDEIKAAWLAWVVATSFEAKEAYGSNRQNPLQNRLASILEVDVASWWRPTSENFFDRVPKGALLSLLDEVGGPALSGRHATQKKSEISPSCEKLFAGEAIVEPEVRDAALAWVPSAMRFNDVATGGEDDEETDDDTEEGEDLTTLLDASDLDEHIDPAEFVGGHDDEGDYSAFDDEDHANDDDEHELAAAE